MPCYDPRDHEPVEVRVNGLTAHQLDALLCGILDAVAPKIQRADLVFNNVDWKECGLTRAQAEMWYDRHKKADAQRKKVADREATRKQLIKDGLKKLSYGEREALGLLTNQIKLGTD